MSADETPSQPQNRCSRIGMHYYPDSLHYRERDLLIWLPALKALGASWLTLLAPADRAIPEPFLRGLLDAGIQPVLHFQLPLTSQDSESPLDLLFDVYANWGVRYAALFDRPNMRHAWPASSWAQADLVERFLDIFLPVATKARHAGLTPVFPPLEPGGDYWDTSFLQAALSGIARRGHDALLQDLHIGAFAWADAQNVEWGAGGPERWPGVRPYSTPQGEQDQRGFYIFDWYIAHTQAALGAPLPILLLAAGQRLPASREEFVTETQELEHAAINQAIARRIIDGGQLGEDESPISPYVLACNFWLLAAESDNEYAPQAWYQADGYYLPVVDAIEQLAGREAPLVESEMHEAYEFIPDPFGKETTLIGFTDNNLLIDNAEIFEAGWDETGTDEGGADTRSPEVEPEILAEPFSETPEEPPTNSAQIEVEPTAHPKPEEPATPPQPGDPLTETSNPLPIAHYLLLPLPDSGAAEWLLEAARPFVLKYHPTVGYSVEEASHPRYVTVVGSEGVFPEALLAGLRSRGCDTNRIAGDGTEIATQLATL